MFRIVTEVNNWSVVAGLSPGGPDDHDGRTQSQHDYGYRSLHCNADGCRYCETKCSPVAGKPYWQRGRFSRIEDARGLDCASSLGVGVVAISTPLTHSLLSIANSSDHSGTYIDGANQVGPPSGIAAIFP